MRAFGGSRLCGDGYRRTACVPPVGIQSVAWLLGALLVIGGMGIQGASAAETGSAGREEIRSASPNPVVQFIDEQIAQGWTDNEVKPSEQAEDAEWLRRVYLDVVGHIPTAEATQEFLEDKAPNKRAVLVNNLLEDPDYVRYFTEVWTNLLIGRTTPDRTSRAGMRKFLREAFGRNRPWNDVVYDLVTAEGNYEANGAVNFLLAQLDGNPNEGDYHVEATARVSRIFLGLQVQCTQCHDHPFNSWKQNQFWEFNSFLRQVRRVDHDRYDPSSGRMVDDYSELVSRNFDGPVYFEKRNGLVQVAYPNYLGTDIDPKVPNRREELARLMCHEDPDHTLAKAMVNRMWGQFFGYGFTRPVDDMGPHNPPSHPVLLDRLTEEFVSSGYDVKELIRWITNSQAYNLTSRFSKGNDIDRPSAGEVPLFSHMYVKTMQAEQLYDSLLIATTSQGLDLANEQQQNERERWLRDFLSIFGGNEDEEPTLFSGTIPQALLMMNGPLVEKAVEAKPGSLLYQILNDPHHRNDAARVQALFLAVLGRAPDRAEMNQLNGLMRREPNKLTAYQDLYWALLNSNEFIVNH